MDPVRITSLQLENVKRVRAVALTPAPTGLTVIGGDNGHGKTTILDAICFALGGEKYRPSNLQRDGGAADARIELELSNGLHIERKGKNAALKVTDPTGTRQGQKLLDAFVEELALNMPKFLAMSAKDKAAVLLRILGIGDQLARLDKEEKAAYDERTAHGRIADQKAKYAAELPEHHDVPELPVSASELVKESQAVMARNAERQAARQNVVKLQDRAERARGMVTTEQNIVAGLQAQLDSATKRLASRQAEWEQANQDWQLAAGVPVQADESTADIERRMQDLEIVNAKVRQNLDKRRAVEDAEAYARKYTELTAAVEDVRKRRAALLDGAAMPLPGLSVDNGELTYRGKAWDCMAGSEQVKAAVAIVRRLKPECGFVLLDGLECFDTANLSELGAWLTEQGLQAIATRVSRGDECSIVIEDGMVVGADEQPAAEKESAELKQW